MQQIDGQFATLKRDATTMDFWHGLNSTDLTHKFSGPLNDPRRTLAPGWPKNKLQMWTNGVSIQGNLWLYNIYKIDATHPFGFIYRQYGVPCSCNGEPFALGLGYSSDSGETWTYLGNILQPQASIANVNGGPYLIVGPYIAPISMSTSTSTSTKPFRPLARSTTSASAPRGPCSLMSWPLRRRGQRAPRVRGRSTAVAASGILRPLRASGPSCASSDWNHGTDGLQLPVGRGRIGLRLREDSNLANTEVVAFSGGDSAQGAPAPAVNVKVQFAP
jgi:hypothetical protein